MVSFKFSKQLLVSCVVGVSFCCFGRYFQRKMLEEDEYFENKKFSKEDVYDLLRKYKENGEVENIISCYLYLIDIFNMTLDDIREIEKDESLLNMLIVEVNKQQ